MNENVKGFKVFNPDWTCRGFQFEVGQIYQENVNPSVCDRGFHFCKEAKDCFNYYSFNPDNKVAEVEALGKVDEGEDKCCTNKIKIIREIPWQELLSIVNLGKGNSGLCNSGNYNSGNRNSGNYNSGNRNSGNRNSGNYNSGNYNSGDWNSGDYNSGNRNSGNYNSSNYNSGNRNSGDWNSGNYNSGNRNSGDYNKASQTIGCFNTESQKLRFFDRETDMTFEQWQNSDARHLLNQIDFKPANWIWSSDMTDEEKAQHPEYETTSGYLKVCDTHDVFIMWWNSLNENQKNIIKNIPNFDAEKFFQITGISI